MGHNVEYDKAGRVIAMTLVNAAGCSIATITWPTGRIKADELSEALASAS